MEKPIVPFGDRWVRDCEGIDVQWLRTPFVVETDWPKELASKVQGVFGYLMVLSWEDALYVVPSVSLGWLLWSFDNGLDQQFSDQEQLAIAGAIGKKAVEEKLEKYFAQFFIDRAKFKLASEEVPTLHSASTKVCDDSGCPEAIFFEGE